ncbi:aluminum-activated malate transporter 2-like isoform X2 [Durio zibethinus]|uniref:Aluminum-activated malate transporter 2-like isoform X2 n=1 Tax=Durio zibethinus TaxID=66656 RepID=A0A6P5ZT65_DURZI|nr:aluminum-activated malate transporter 2-like isoform X2 [Durio zibethinus]
MQAFLILYHLDICLNQLAMDLEFARQEKEKQGLFARGWSGIKEFPNNIKTRVFEFFSKPLYDSFGVSAMWAVMTVVVVFEFSVGATLGKGVNRGLATLLAGALAVGAHKLANLSGRIGEPIVLGFFVFLQAAVSTFARFYPKIKARYDYGLLIFILTFSLISVSGFRDDEILELVHKRSSTVLIGGSTCVIVSIFLFPVWAGEDLHNLIASNMEKLGSFLEGFGDEYFKIPEDGESKGDKSFLQGYKSVLNSKSDEDALSNFARWEPGHGRFQFRHPWKQYLKIGALTRQCAYRIESLNGHINAEIQANPEIRSKIQESCTKMSLESGKALKELAFAIKRMVKPFSAGTHIENSKSAAKNLNSLLKSGLWDGDVDLLQLVPVATVASLLIEVVTCTVEIAESVHELSSMVNFEAVEPTVSPQKPETGQPEIVKSSNDANFPSVIIIISEPSPENGNSSATTMNNCSSRPTNTEV